MTSPSSANVPTPKRLDSQAYGRFYLVEGQPEPFPSVTHVLSCLGKPALINWAAREERKLVFEAAADLYVDTHQTPLMMRPVYLDVLEKRVTKTKAHKRQLEKAGEIGSQVHHRVEWQLRKDAGQVVGPEPPMSADAAVAYVKFEEWSLREHLKPLFLEQPIWSTKHRYAGTLDFYGLVGKTPVLIDWKTSSAVFPEMHLQVGAYMHALYEIKIGKPKAGFIVRFPKKAGDDMEVVEILDWKQRFREFLKVRAMFDIWYAWERAYQDKREAEKAARVAS